jgi:hypothetical protein
VTFGQRFYILGQNGVGAALFNALLNAGIGWGITAGLAEFPVWKAPGVAFDFVLTAFGITFGTCLVLPLSVTRDAARGRISLPEDLPNSLSALIARFPKRRLARGVLLGLVSVPVFALPALVGLLAFGGTAMGRIPFVELKALLSGIQGGLVTPPIVLAVLSDLSSQKAEGELPSLSAEAE